MQKLVLLSPAHPLRGGIASSTERLALELQQQGYEVTIYSFSYQYPSLLFPGKTQYADGPAPEGLHIRSVIHSINPFNWWKVGQELHKARPDLIIARYWLPFMGPSMGTILRLARRNGHTRTLAITDNVIPHEQRPGDRLLTRYFIGAVQAFVVMSRSVGQDIRQFTLNKPVKYIPHPIYDNYGPLVRRNEAIQKLGLDESQRYLLFFGFIRAYKGLDLLLRALAEEKVRKLGVKLIVAGEFYEEEEGYRKLVEEEGLQEQVIFQSAYIPNEDVRYYFGAADLVVQPYKTATQSGISQLAFHFQKPMIVTRVGGLPEIVAHGKEGYVVEVEADAIAEAIVDFYEKDRQAAMEKAVKAGQARYSWDNLVRGIRELYDEIKTL
ncbi:MAG TPA: glycosyltransferase [Phaeodactylibacter sp.]|nr:glycosyltransferase [Phaeodactylibacter sp.]